MATVTIPQVRFQAIDGVRIRYEEPARSAAVILDSITANRP
jgi:hypothetical protein